MNQNFKNRNCEWCGEEFTPASPTTKFCQSACKRRSDLYAQIPESFHNTAQNVDEFFQRHLYNQDSKRLYKTRVEDWVIERSPNGVMVQYWVDKIESMFPDPKISRVKKFNLYIKELHKKKAKNPPKTSICQVCDKEYEVKPLARKSFTCSPECQDFRKVNKLSPDKIEQAKAAFDPENLVEWTNQFMCRQNEKGPGYNQTAFEDPRWTRLNRLEEEVQVVCKAINAHNMDVPSEASEKLSRRDLWKTWQKGTKYRPCAHCGGVGKFHQYRGWQEFCSVDCQRSAIADHSSDLKDRILASCRNVDHETRKVKYEQTMVERYGYKSNLGDSDTIDAIMETKRNNNPDWGRSRLERQLAEHLKGLGVEVIENDRKLIGRELDIYLPEFKVAIEVNGVIYHSEKYDFDEQGQPRPKKKETRARHRHIWKTKECEEQGVHLIHVWHDEINTVGGFKRFTNRINHMLGFNKGRIYGRQTKVVERSKEDIKRFLNQHHLQGSVSNFSKGFGLEKDEMLVAVMTFTNINDGSVTLSRFASVGVTGGFSKLLKHYTELHPKTDVYSFGDRDKVNRWNNVYLSNGFEEVEVLRPDYMYTNGGPRRHKFGFRKKRLLAQNPELDPNWTEYEMALHLGYYRVWGTGLFKYKLSK